MLDPNSGADQSHTEKVLETSETAGSLRNLLRKFVFPSLLAISIFFVGLRYVYNDTPLRLGVYLLPIIAIVFPILYSMIGIPRC